MASGLSYGVAICVGGVFQPVLGTVADGMFYYLPVVLGYTAVKKFKMSEFIGMALGFSLIYPTMVALTSGNILGSRWQTPGHAAKWQTPTLDGVPTMTMYLCTYPSPVGELTLTSDGPHLCGLWLDGQKYFKEKLPVRVLGSASESGDQTVEGERAIAASPALQAAIAWLDVYFDGRDPGDLPPIALHGTPFQERVWDQIARIPYGETVTYGGIAKALAAENGDGKKVSARAVGVAVGRNPCSVIVPCHRVVGSTGSLTGYSGGIARKVRLLQLEGVDTSRFKVPTRGTAL